MESLNYFINVSLTKNISNIFTTTITNENEENLKN